MVYCLQLLQFITIQFVRGPNFLFFSDFSILVSICGAISQLFVKNSKKFLNFNVEKNRYIIRDFKEMFMLQNIITKNTTGLASFRWRTFN